MKKLLPTQQQKKTMRWLKQAGVGLQRLAQLTRLPLLLVTRSLNQHAELILLLKNQNQLR
jgi:hypothetical protein